MVSWICRSWPKGGCFLVKTWKSQTNKTGIGIRLAFTLTQHHRDVELLRSIIKELGCGRIVVRPNVSTVELEVTKLSHLTEVIIPLFSKYSLHGDKINDFNDFKKVAMLMKNKSHLTPEGIEEIMRIKLGMNKGRYIG